MRCRSIPPAPAVLAGPDSEGAEEIAAATDYYSSEPPPARSYKFKVYRSQPVKDALNSAFGHKCAYCESDYAPTAQVDVEHYRPKAGVVSATGRTLKPGYYWLAATWTNLLPSCHDCNRARQQRTVDGESGVSGKANRFPLADERRRVTRPGSVEREEPLLLHPYFDDASEHLECWHPEGVVRPRADPSAPHGESRRGRATCDVLGLNRDGLARAREAYRRRVEIQLEHIAEAEEDVGAHPGAARYEQRLRRELGRLDELWAEDAPYTLMTRQLVQRHRAGEAVR